MYTNSLGTDYQQLSVTGSDSSSSVKAKKDLGKEDFLNLLITQLKHQDPLNPMESQEFSAQLAQFSSLEQLSGMNETLLEIQKNLEANENENILDYIGKVVKTSDNTLSVTGGTVDSSVYSLNDSANVNISIYDALGAEIRSISAGLKEAGEHSVGWDGRDNDGNKVDDGVYSLRINAADQTGASVSSDVYHTGEVTGVTNQNNVPYLMVGKKLVSPDQIIEVTKLNS
ncbi:MAG: flagellar hook assembly protein FlgD [Desulfobacteraceae bacterium]|nr:MAG: flagellar hook assembly protein FlgD [Desulfobacteraceae bacterium]